MQKISIGVLSALLFAATALPQSASAQDSRQGAYVNVGAAILNADFNLDGLDTGGTGITFEDETANIVVLNGRLGYRFNKFIAAEVEGGFGLGGDTVSQSVPFDTGVVGTVDVDVDANLDINTYGAGFIRAILPVSDQIDLFVRGGYGIAGAELDVDITAATAAFGSVSTSDSFDGFAFGGGGEYHINDKHGVRLDFSAINGDEIDALFFSAAYSYKF